MKKIFNSLKNVAGLLALVALTLGLVWLFSAAREGAPVGQQVSPIKTPVPTVIRETPVPTATSEAASTLTPLPDGVSVLPTPGGKHPGPTSTPDPAGIRPIGGIPPHTPSPPEESKLYPIHTSDDVIAIALRDPFLQSRLESECRRGAIPGDPIFVKYIGEDADGDWGYYLVPFYKENYIVLTAVVNTIGNLSSGPGMIAECSCGPEAVARRAANPRKTPQDYLPVSADKARKLAEEERYTIEGEPRLVFRRLLEGADKFAPFWEFKTAEGETLYVILKARSPRVYRANEVHSIQ